MHLPPDSSPQFMLSSTVPWKRSFKPASITSQSPLSPLVQPQAGVTEPVKRINGCCFDPPIVPEALKQQSLLVFGGTELEQTELLTRKFPPKKLLFTTPSRLKVIMPLFGMTNVVPAGKVSGCKNW